MRVYFDSWVVPMGVKHNEIDESECIRNGFKKKSKHKNYSKQQKNFHFMLNDSLDLD
jgi:Zn ribbon nucleic-acid-binding protein